MKTSNIFYCLIILVIIFSCNSTRNSVLNESKIITYSKKMKLPPGLQYRMVDSLQNYALEKGQPYINVYDKQMRELKVGTCYMELPYFIDTLFFRKKLVIDTLTFYQKNYTPIDLKIKEMTGVNGNKAIIDRTKKYYVFYHYAMYAKDFDKKVMPYMYEKYKDSVQFFFINTDKFKEN